MIPRLVRDCFSKGQARIDELNAILQDNFSGIKEIQGLQQTGEGTEKSAREVLAACQIVNTGAFPVFIVFIICFLPRCDLAPEG